MSDKKNPVAIESQWWQNMQATWHLVHSLWGGTDAMRVAGRTYLPQEPAEPEAAYRNRLAKSVLTPIYMDTIKKLMGKIMRQPVVLEEDVPPSVIRYMSDIDTMGTDINEWTKRIGEAALNDGVTYILVDAPNADQQRAVTGTNVTFLDTLQGRTRPYAVHVAADQVIGWKSKTVDGRSVLTQVRIYCITEEDGDDEFSTVEVHRIHVIEQNRKRTYLRVVEEDGSTDWVLEEDLATDFDNIPLIAVYGGQPIGFMKGQPPLLDVAHLNVAHWQSDSDQRHITHVARVPLLFGSGLGEDEDDFQIEIGPNTMTKGPMGSDMKYVEHTGNSIEAGLMDLEILESRMAKIGLNMVIRRATGDVTATSRALDQAETDSPLGMFARHLESKLEEMLDWFAWIIDRKTDEGGSVTVFKDFTIGARDADDIKALADMRVRGDISQRTFWEECKRRGLLADNFDAEKEIDLLDLEYQDGMLGLSEEEDNAANHIGDTTGNTDGHTHVLQANGFTNVVNGHRHTWEPTASVTSVDDGHSHSLGGIGDGEVTRSQTSQEPQGQTQQAQA
jgi:hypothetical protein